MSDALDKQHLKSRQHYIDLYDRGTVEQCRRSEKSFDEKKELQNAPKGMSRKKAEQALGGAKEWYLKFQTGERYLNKDKTIREWMERDEKLDQLLESAQAPEGIRCLSCRNLVKPTFKTLWYSSGKDMPERVLFMYDCPNNCMPRRAFFSDGEEWRVKPDLCPNCRNPVEKKMEDDDKKITTIMTCAKCGYKNTDEHEWTYKKDEGVDPNFAADRDRFCLTDKEGQEFYEMKSGLERLGKLMEEFKEQDKARDEKLKANPKGFHLDGSYTCAICGQHTPPGDNWYDKYGIKCLVCQKAIDEGEIPAKLAKDKDSWYSKWDLESNFNLKAPTISKWVRHGILKSRTISNYGKGVHAEIFLLEDNKDFLPPKKKLESKGGAKWYQLHDPFKHLKGYKIMDYMRVVPPEEMKAREEEKQRKWEEKRKLREQIKQVRARKKRKKKE